MAPRHSGLQKDVLALYRRALRMVHSKPSAVRENFDLFVRYTFRTRASSVSPRDVAAIEHLLRHGRRQVEIYEDSKVRNCFVSREMMEWGQQHGGRTSRITHPA
ncbi:uncharacterized protein C8Q71DRAFT_737673 [Rhodofomes roseus]|uniref:Complex 1 LYR protein domain-containing protein n=1 Tax=Rhodofomes roseus TaxID=34475 RepID=A0ABQ8KS49_9APHY|nr:uncharacterized protein C8Q71DRAFT_737673 [Rhodofomes roseus]KAH9841567.1 hypothetical protein C8Q71DRAFT_737673 [Rhodofomes roseus]